MTDLFNAAKGSPLMFAALFLLGVGVYLTEHLCGVNGPLTRLWAAWNDRELRRLRRDALVLAERRSIQAAEERGRVGDLTQQLADLRALVHEQGRDLAAARQRERRREAQLRALGDYVDRLLRAARAAGVPFADPPDEVDTDPIPIPAASPETARTPEPAAT